jgi:signal transduction histidine kinase
MRSAGGWRSRRGGLRWRITIAFVGAALAVSALVAGVTYVLAERYLTEQRIDDAIQQSYSSMRLITRYLSTRETDISLNELGPLLQPQISDALVVESATHFFSSSVSITPASVPAPLKEAVAAGEVGYAITGGGSNFLVFGTPVPSADPTQTDPVFSAFFFYPLTTLGQTLDFLRNVLLLVSAGAVALALLAGSRVSARVVDPVRRAGQAARQVAEGLLETRLPVGGRDELAALAASFNEMAAALEERIARERRFVGDVSHELRTPLTTLRTSTDYLLEHAAALPRDVRRAAQLLSADAAYLQRLVDDLLDLSAVEAGRVQMRWERLSLADLAREVVARMARGAKRDVRIEVEGDPSDLYTIADKQRLERVVGNLVDNALIHGGGSDVMVHVGSEDGTLLLSVEDRGPGVPADARGRIFERFYKGDPARRRDEGRGSGLGLAIARENAHLHGGDIQMAGADGRGARFTVRIPRREEEPAT